MKKERLFYIDCIRVISTFFIVCCHFSTTFFQYNIAGFNNYILNFANTDTGKLGVYLFFMISGSALIYNYGNNISISQFYKNRCVKIFPLFYLTWLFFYFIKVREIRNFLYNGNILRIGWTLLGLDYYVGGMYPTYAIVGEWFTGAIIIIYIIFPLLKWLYNSNLRYYLTSIILYILYFVNFFIIQLPHTTNTESIFVDIFYFWLGMMLIREREKIERIPIPFLVIPLIPMLIVKNQFSVTSNSLAISLIIYALCMKIKNTNLLKTNIAFNFIAKYSYAIYLIHHQIIYLVMKNFANTYMPIWKAISLFLVIWSIIIIMAFILTKLNDTILNVPHRRLNQ